MDGWLAILISVPLTFAASWFGGRFHASIGASHLRIQTLLSFVGGLMLGMAVLHLIPHAMVHLPSVDVAMYAVLCGMLGTFLLMRFLHVHSHEPGVACADTEHDHAHEAREHLGPETAETSSGSGSGVRWLVLLSGLGLHGVVDGLAIASAVRLACGDGGGWAGLSVLVVVMLHKPIDAVSLTGTMAAGGETVAKRRLVNFAYASITPIATVAAYAGLPTTGAGPGLAMAVAAGAFICVALADLMPEVQFHSHHRVRLTLALLAGVTLAWSIGLLEPEHSHGPVGSAAAADHSDHSGHAH